MENENKGLESRIWGSRWGYAIEQFQDMIGHHWDTYAELTHNNDTIIKVVSYICKIIGVPLLAILGAPLAIPAYMADVKYSPERRGYVVRN